MHADFPTRRNCAKYVSGAVQQVTITDPSNGKTATATVEDKCEACAAGDLGKRWPVSYSSPHSDEICSVDMSPSLFQHFEDLAVGRFDITWSFT
jgi:hypothetical protein